MVCAIRAVSGAPYAGTRRAATAKREKDLTLTMVVEVRQKMDEEDSECEASAARVVQVTERRIKVHRGWGTIPLPIDAYIANTGRRFRPPTSRHGTVDCDLSAPERHDGRGRLRWVSLLLSTRWTRSTESVQLVLLTSERSGVSTSVKIWS